MIFGGRPRNLFRGYAEERRIIISHSVETSNISPSAIRRRHRHRRRQSGPTMSAQRTKSVSGRTVPRNDLLRHGAWRNSWNERSVTRDERCITDTGWMNPCHLAKTRNEVSSGAIPKSNRKERARSSVENGVIIMTMRSLRRAHIVVQVADTAQRSWITKLPSSSSRDSVMFDRRRIERCRSSSCRSCSARGAKDPLTSSRAN